MDAGGEPVNVACSKPVATWQKHRCYQFLLTALAQAMIQGSTHADALWLTQSAASVDFTCASMPVQKKTAITLGVKDWEPLLLLPEPGPARCSCPGCPAIAPLAAGAAGGDLLQMHTPELGSADAEGCQMTENLGHSSHKEPGRCRLSPKSIIPSCDAVAASACAKKRL